MQQTAVLPISVYDISACNRAQPWQQEVSLLAVMQLAAVLPNIVYDICACERDQPWQQAVSLLAVSG